MGKKNAVNQLRLVWGDYIYRLKTSDMSGKNRLNKAGKVLSRSLKGNRGEKRQMSRGRLR